MPAATGMELCVWRSQSATRRTAPTSRQGDWMLPWRGTSSALWFRRLVRLRLQMQAVE